jgi:hypothetical protein
MTTARPRLACSLVKLPVVLVPPETVLSLKAIRCGECDAPSHYGAADE